MKLLESPARFERFNMNWRRLLMQGLVIFLMGLILVFASVLNPDAVVMSARYFSWLPLCGIIILALGLLECLDAFLAKEQRDFFQNLQVGVLDTVVGGLIILSVTEEPARLSLMIAAFLMVRGIVRIVLTYALSLPQIISTAVCGLISILAGFMVFLGWPTSAGWFIALCLSIEIAFRGWAMMMFSLWVRKQNL
ncbi:MAG: hypothetical protein EPN89_15955 [Methylovulum sp.]|nr:MAG: hypothetical protein EPN89_15955 [Methylovulum sp.]